MSLSKTGRNSRPLSAIPVIGESPSAFRMMFNAPLTSAFMSYIEAFFSFEGKENFKQLAVVF